MELKSCNIDFNGTAPAGSNRTFMELKFGQRGIAHIAIFGSNRTFMELK